MSTLAVNARIMPNAKKECKKLVPTYKVVCSAENLIPSIHHILLQTGDSDYVRSLVLGEANVHLVLLHDLGNGLTTLPDQTAVHTVINLNLNSDLLLLCRGMENNTHGMSVKCTCVCIRLRLFNPAAYVTLKDAGLKRVPD